jgi:heme/copper-type cytochrome/quinol oxidase subunit 1
MIIAVASGVQIFCWLATLWTGRIYLRTALYFVLGFIFIFVLGGLTGVMLAAIPLNLQVHDTFFVVAHFHYVLIGGALFPLFGAFYHWFPKFTGRLMDERLGVINFWVLFIGFNLTFFPMHMLGLKGMTRRIYTYPAEMGWGPANALATFGALVIAAGGVIFIVNAVRSRNNGEIAGNNPWDAGTLEWAAASPPPPYNFVNLPCAGSRYPLWSSIKEQVVVTGLRDDRREALVTTSLDAEPSHRLPLPGPSIWPFVSAIGFTIGLIGAVWYFSWYGIAALLGGLGLLFWFWPRARESSV